MTTLLHMDASVRADSLSRQLSGRFAERWRSGHPEGTVVRRDLGANPLPHVTESQVNHLMYQSGGAEDAQSDGVLRAERLLDELRSADLLLLATPMYNFTIPATVKSWIDQIAWPGRAFDPVAGRGLLDVPAVVILTRGGGYGPGSPRADWNFQDAYLRKVFEFVGMTDVEFVIAELTMFTGEDSPDQDLKAKGEQSLKEAVTRIDELTPLTHPSG